MFMSNYLTQTSGQIARILAGFLTVFGMMFGLSLSANASMLEDVGWQQTNGQNIANTGATNPQVVTEHRADPSPFLSGVTEINFSNTLLVVDDVGWTETENYILSARHQIDIAVLDAAGYTTNTVDQANIADNLLTAANPGAALNSFTALPFEVGWQEGQSIDADNSAATG